MKRKSILNTFILTFILITMLGSNLAFAAIDNPLDYPDYPNDTDGSHNTPEGKTLEASVSYTTDKSEYYPGDVASISLTLTSVVGDTNDGNNKDLLFILKNTDQSTIFFSKPDPITIDNINGYHITGGESDSFSALYDLTGAVPGTTYQLPYIVYDYGKFGGTWQKTVIATGVVELKVIEPTYSVKIKPTIYEFVNGVAVENKNVGAVAATVGGNVIGTSNEASNPIVAFLPANTPITLDAQEASGYVFYSWLYNINNNKNPGDNGYRYDPRDVVTQGKNETFSPTPVFIQAPDLTLTFMQGAADPTEMRTYRVFHEDANNALYPLTLGYEVSPGSIVKLENTFGFNHTKDLRFDDPFLFESGNQVGIDSSETVKLYWYNYGTNTWMLADTKASSTLYEVKYDPNNGVLNENEDVIYVYHGNSISEPIPSRSGFSFLGWDYSQEINLDAVTSSNSAIAIWEEIIETENPTDNPNPEPPVQTVPVITYLLTVTSTEGGKVPGFEGTNAFASGTNVNLGVVAEDGYEFAGWTGDVSNNVVVMNEDKTVTANFALILEDEEVAQDINVPVLEEVAVPVVPTDIESDTDEILDEVTPEELGEALPETGGASAMIFYLFGTALTGAGVSIKKRK